MSTHTLTLTLTLCQTQRKRQRMMACRRTWVQQERRARLVMCLARSKLRAGGLSRPHRRHHRSTSQPPTLLQAACRCMRHHKRWRCRLRNRRRRRRLLL